MKGMVIKDEVTGVLKGLIMECHLEVFCIFNSEMGRFGKVLSRGIHGLP